jgi:hypothetical protein
MKSGNNINKALKEALQNYPVPLNESQWDRISGDLEKKKNKKPFFWLSIFSTLLVLLSVLFYNFSDSNKSESSQSLAQNQSLQNTEITTNTETKISKSNNSDLITPQIQSKENTNQQDSKPQNTENSLPNENVSNQNRTKHETNKVKKNTVKQKVSESSQIKSNKSPTFIDVPFNPSLLESTASLQSALNQYVLNYLLLEPQYVAPYEIQKQNENFDWFTATLVKNNKKRNSKSKNIKPPKDDIKNSIAIGLMYGISMVNSKSSIDKQNSLHKDTRKVFDAAAKNQTSKFLKVTLDIPLTKRFNLGLNSGFQYRYVTQNAEYNYNLDSIPFRDVDNRVLFYLANKDSSNAKFNGSYKNVYQYLNIPLNLTYRLPMNSKNEFLIGAGLQFNMVLKNKGQMFDLNDQRFKDNSEFLKTSANFGWMGSLEYSRQFQNHWWLGLGMGIQNQNLKFASENGYIINSLKFNSFHLHLRYKL